MKADSAARQEAILADREALEFMVRTLSGVYLLYCARAFACFTTLFTSCFTALFTCFTALDFSWCAPTKAFTCFTSTKALAVLGQQYLH